MSAWWQAADGATVALLAGLTLLEGLRRLPAGGVVLRRVLGGAWRADAVEWPRPALVSWWAPLTTAVVCAPWTADAGGEARGHLRLAELGHAVRWHVRALTALGALVLAGLVLGVPTMAGLLGGAGFLAAAGAVLLLSLATAACGYAALRRLGLRRRPAARRALAWCSPFGAPQARQQVLEHLVAGAPPLSVARWLLPALAFAAWVRPRAWDAAHGAPDPELAVVLAEDELRALLAAPPAALDPTAAGWCPRCGALWRITGPCPACAVELCIVRA